MVAVIGDVHGCYYTLAGLYDKIRAKYNSIPIYCVGDLVDRGNNSYEVFLFVLEKQIKFTPGNHDYMFYHFFKDPASIFARSWVFNGNETTLESYENHEQAVFKHIDIIKSAPLVYNLDDCHITHAGIAAEYETNIPKNYREDQNVLEKIIYNDYKNDDGVLWARGKLLNIGKLQVVGHTKHREITFDKEANAIYIDTGACVGNKLSAIIVENNEVLDRIEENTHLSDII